MRLSDMSSYFVYALALGLPLLFLIRRAARPPRPAVTAQTDTSPKTIMQPPRDDLDPPKDDAFSLAALAAFDGAHPSEPIYVSIKGTQPTSGPHALTQGGGAQATCST